MEQNKYLDIVCQVMNAAMKGEHLDLSDYVNDKEFLRIMEEQTFQPFLYKVDKRPEFRKYYIQASLINDKFDKIGNKIKEIFDANNIDHIFLKGFELKKLYPDPCIRQMGDIDILVREEDHEKAINVLKESGFKQGKILTHHTEFKYQGIEIELHNKLIDEGEKYEEYLYNPFSKSINKNNNTYILNDDFNLLFLVIHYIKHLKKGEGLRELCDLYFMFSSLNIDLSNLLNFINKEKLTAFFDCLLTQLNFIFSFDKIPYNRSEHFSELISYSISSGAHGFGEEQMQFQNQFKNTKKTKFSYLLSRLFIPLSELFQKYPWTKSIILIPIGYIVRFFFLLKYRKDKLNIIINTTNDNILTKIGLLE